MAEAIMTSTVTSRDVVALYAPCRHDSRQNPGTTRSA